MNAGRFFQQFFLGIGMCRRSLKFAQPTDISLLSLNTNWIAEIYILLTLPATFAAALRLIPKHYLHIYVIR